MEIMVSSAVRTAVTMNFFLLISLYSFISVIAHVFTPNESASFISLVDQIKSALTSINEYDSSNKTAIGEQAKYARMLLTQSVLKELNERNQRIGTELPRLLDSLQNIPPEDLNGNISMLNDLLAEALTVRVEKDQMTNATVQALAFAEDVDKILDEYNAAFNKSTIPMNMNMNMNMSEDNMTSMANVTKREVIKNTNAYQRAVALTDIAIDRFNTELKGKSNVTLTMDEVAKGLDELKNFIQNKEHPTKVMGIVHGGIQPNLQTAFNLELAQPVSQVASNMSDSMSNMNNSMQDHMMNMS
jgi:CO dehydrogenase/acetyl-CoA synthase beta subunit